MKKLELKHLIPYLPYNLKYTYHRANFFTGKATGKIKTDLLISIDTCLGKIYGFHSSGKVESIRPILRPLSDLPKAIEYDSKRFRPLDKLVEIQESKNPLAEVSNKYAREFLLSLSIKKGNIPYWMAEKLFEWHFDVHGLIPEGFAIDINTIK